VGKRAARASGDYSLERGSMIGVGEDFGHKEPSKKNPDKYAGVNLGR
jgi:hypothetical protein